MEPDREKPVEIQAFFCLGFDPATQRASHDAINGHDPYAYLKGVLTRLPSQRASEIEVAGS